MPRITIREIDKSTPGLRQYSNFSVLVPGFAKYNYADSKDPKSPFDENGVYECTSVDAFVDNVGKTVGYVQAEKSQEAITRTPCIVEGVMTRPMYEEGDEYVSAIKAKLGKPSDETLYTVYPLRVVNDETVTLTAKDIIWSYWFGKQLKITGTEGTNKPAGTNGVPVKQDLSWTYTAENEAELTDEQILYYDSDSRKLYTPLDCLSIDGLTKVGETTYISLSDDKSIGSIDYFPELVPVVPIEEDPIEPLGEDLIEDNEDTTDYWVTMCTAYGDAGTIGEPAVYTMHYGNQIAYKLLELGYTVLYKYIKPEGEAMIKTGYDAVGKEKIEKRAYVSIDTLKGKEFWTDDLKDKATYDFRYVLSGMLEYNAGVDDEIIKLVKSKDTADMFTKADVSAQGRGDCIALIDLDRRLYEGCTQSEAILNITGAADKTVDDVPSIAAGSKYATIFAPYVVYDAVADADYDNNNTFPCAFHYLACASKSLTRFREWYAISGYTRGVSDLKIKGAGINFGEQAIQVLQPRYNTLTGATAPFAAINLLARIKGVYYLWGNRTAEPLTNDGLIASHFLNIRQLCTTLKKQLYVVCRQLTFDPNSDLLWNKLVDAITPTLERMKNDQGIRDYRLYKIPTTEKATLQVRLHIVPIEAVEDFDINFFLEDSIDNITLSIEEFGG